ncbi:MAG: prolipoprotein diacylglyceryl transferase [Spirochaetaceae bacterium]|jgi:phosphatidylglycerol:prolipoprotein diacylglycerol transferase|nr:prolipoprotein diacylglyceryl transferase [Spirochaetaceae bacterium]
MLLSIPFPSWLHPEIIPGLPIRWYGLMYLVAFAIAFLLYRKQVRERNFPMNEDELSGLFVAGIAGLIIGARIFSTLVYEPSDIYVLQPWLIFWPFRNGRFTGLAGMSYHGGVIGGIAGFVMYSKIKKINGREIADMFGASIPLGYTFGRLGNFANAELYGRVTAGPLGMIFPNAQWFSTAEGWVQEIAGKAGIDITGQSMVNLPRHPSQLYEAFFEGVVLWLIIWLMRNRKPFTGFLAGVYIMGYGFIRFILEYFREPDADLGYRIELVKNGVPPALFSSLFNFTTGQILNFLMIAGGGVWLIIVSRLPDRKPVFRFPDKNAPPVHDAAAEEKRISNRKNRRKLRKKLR